MKKVSNLNFESDFKMTGNTKNPFNNNKDIERLEELSRELREISSWLDQTRYDLLQVAVEMNGILKKFKRDTIEKPQNPET